MSHSNEYDGTNIDAMEAPFLPPLLLMLYAYVSASRKLPSLSQLTPHGLMEPLPRFALRNAGIETVPVSRCNLLAVAEALGFRDCVLMVPLDGGVNASRVFGGVVGAETGPLVLLSWSELDYTRRTTPILIRAWIYVFTRSCSQGARLRLCRWGITYDAMTGSGFRGHPQEQAAKQHRGDDRKLHVWNSFALE